MKETKHKYATEYENSIGCFWGTSPAKFVSIFADFSKKNIANTKVLDLGAGEGKNAVFLAALDAYVTAIDLSKIALSRFNIQPNYISCKERINIINNDVRNVDFELSEFDTIIAYGILHCLDTKEEVKIMIEKITKWLKPGGYLICATFTNKISAPNIQSYLEEDSFLAEGELEKLLTQFHILKSENEIITETHPTSNIEHKHSIVRLIAQKRH